MLRYAIQQFDGEASLAARGEQVARQWAQQINRLLDQNIVTRRRRDEIVRFEDGEVLVRVLVEDVGGDRLAHLWVSAAGGCADIPPFLLKNDTATGWYWAYYNDGSREHINPVTRTPRPNPDPAVRTKQVKVPTELLTGTKRGSMFSGQMRMVVQCEHARGANSRFAYGWTKTHGLLALIDQAPFNDGGGPSAAIEAAAQRYWVVEASASGVYVAPVEWSGRCCDGFSVENYLPTGAQVKASPALAVYRDELNLAWAYSQRRAGVALVLTPDQMALAYAGTPFKAADGWAFSRTGQHAQAVTARQVAMHYRTERWRIDFVPALSGGVYSVSASIALAETGDLYFSATDPLWVPDGLEGEWAAVPRMTTPDIGSASGPVHVYYQGEAEHVTRYSHSGAYATIPAASYGTAKIGRAHV